VPRRRRRTYAIVQSVLVICGLALLVLVLVGCDPVDEPARYTPAPTPAPALTHVDLGGSPWYLV